MFLVQFAQTIIKIIIRMNYNWPDNIDRMKLEYLSFLGKVTRSNLKYHEPGFIEWGLKISFLHYEFRRVVPRLVTVSDYDWWELAVESVNEEINIVVEKFEESEDEFELDDDFELPEPLWNRERLESFVNQNTVKNCITGSNDEDICVVCLDSCSTKVTKCNHYFHPNCLFLCNSSKCPLCNEKL